MVRRPCPHPECTACRAGRPDFCYTGDYTERGIQGRHGFMTEYVVDDASYMHKVPAALRPVGILTEPLTIAEKGVGELNAVQSRLPDACRPRMPSPQRSGGLARTENAPPPRKGYSHEALVLGAGPVGLLGAMVVAAAGFSTTVYSREPARGQKARLVEALGARYVSAGDADPGQLAEQIGRIDLIFEATGASRLSFEMMPCLGTNGVFIFTGVPGRKGDVEVPGNDIMRNLVLRNQVVYGTVNADDVVFERAIRDLGVFRQRWPEAVEGLITRRAPLEDYADLLLSKPTGIKNVLTLGA